MMNNEKGFTLVELLLVVVVIGVLSSFGVMALNTITETTRRRTDEANVRILNSATKMLSLEEEESLETVFNGMYDDRSRLNYLVSNDVLENIPKPAQASLSFVWDADPEVLRWMLGTAETGGLFVNADWAHGLTDWDYGPGVTANGGIVQSTGGRLRQVVDPILGGATYTLMFEARAEGSVSGGMQITWYDAEGDLMANIPMRGFVPTDSWQEFSLTGSAPQGAQSARVEVLRGLDVEEGSVVYVRNVSFRRD